MLTRCCWAPALPLCVFQAVQLDHVGGYYGPTQIPTPFLCLTLKLLQLQPDKEIITEYIKQEDYKYLRALAVRRLACRAHGETHSCARCSGILLAPRGAAGGCLHLFGAAPQRHSQAAHARPGWCARGSSAVWHSYWWCDV